MIQLLSDTHFDFWVSPHKPFKPSRLTCIEHHFTKADTLLLAGDIGHYPKQNIAIFDYLRKYYNNIALVLGNHDYYVTKTNRRKYPTYQLWEAHIISLYRSAGITVLDGDTVTLDNRTIFGYPAWYDDTLYTQLANQYSPTYTTKWQQTMNDSKHIPSLQSPYDMIAHQRAKLTDLQPVDIAVSHIRPYISLEGTDSRFSDLSHSFYMFDGKDLLEALKPSIYLYGHTHTCYHQIRDGVEYFCNPLAYPGENNPKQVLI